jgi:DNA-binding winged helix-turn-helix (wHTH) protein/tetratricopeptide (TPR) repeat protein
MASETRAGQVFRFGLFEADVARDILRRKGARVRIQDQPFRVLIFLLERRGEIVTREELKQKLWPEGTFVDFDGSLNVILKKLRAALDDDADNPVFIETVPKKGYKFIAPVSAETIQPVSELPVAPFSQASVEVTPASRVPEKQIVPPSPPRFKFAGWKVALVVLPLLAAAGYRLLFVRKVQALKSTDTIVIADFANQTGDPVFDDSLKQALSLQLSQSPFLSLIPEGRVRSTMRQMGLATTDSVTAETARKICQRTNSAAVIAGSIRTAGSQYTLELKALSCATGDSLADEEVQAPRKDDVLPALDRASNALRTKVGEPLLSVAKYDIPVYQATTRSLEALKAYSLGAKIELSKGSTAAIPFFQHALELDPDFALAYNDLGLSHHNSGEVSLGAEFMTKAFERRDRVTESERFLIESTYYSEVTGELEKANTIYEVWSQTYPRDPLPRHNLSANLAAIGQYDKAAAEAREALRLTPSGSTSNTSYSALMQWLTTLDRLDEAKAVYKEAQEHNVNNSHLHWNQYSIAFLENDQPEMQRQLQWASGKAGIEDILLMFQSDTEAFQGHWQDANHYLDQAIDSDRRNNLKETMALIEACGALRAAEFGYKQRARKQIHQALTDGDSRDIEILGALALARIGDLQQASAMADKLSKAFPLDTLIQAYWVPVIRASVELARHNPAQAINLLEVAKPYELGTPDTWFEEGGPLYPAYLRGEAYLAMHDGSRAADEFHKYPQHRGIVQNCYLGAFAHLGLAHAYTEERDMTKARTAFEDFFALWKNADPDIPVLKQAQAEYARLQ